MSDISKCTGESCEKRDTCYRFTAPVEPLWQAYLEPNRTATECLSYWPPITVTRATTQPVRIAYKFPTAQPSSPSEILNNSTP